MPNLYCMYWAPGSGGDTLQHLLSMNPSIQTGASYELNAQGRTQRYMVPEFESQFPGDDQRWLWRNWTTDECEMLLEQSRSQLIVIGTHDYNQVKFLKQTLKLDIETVGVVYDKTLWPFVLKNYCVKTQDSDPVSCYFYQQQNAPLYAKLKENNAFGAWVLKNQLLIHHEVPVEIDHEFDHRVALSRLLINDLQWFDQHVNEQGRRQFELWLSLQNPLYRVKLDYDPDFLACLGGNVEAIEPDLRPIALDAYDMVFVSHYVKAQNLPRCTAKTHWELRDFFRAHRRST